MGLLRNDKSSFKNSLLKLSRGSIRLDERNADSGRISVVLKVFDQWSEQQMKDTLHSEPCISRIYRRIAVVAGLVRPLNERDYIRGVKKYGGNLEDFDAFFLQDKYNKCHSGYQLNSKQLPFDAYHLFKLARSLFLLYCILFLFLILSLLFTTWGFAVGCFEEGQLNLVNYIPHGFLILSGLGDIVIQENSHACLWMNTVAIVIGVYITLPVFGAIVLVRLLDNRADLIKSSNTLLLTKIFDKPVVMIRCVSGNGRPLHNFSAALRVVFFDHDEDLDERFIMSQYLEVNFSCLLTYFPTVIKHVCDNNSPLIQKNIVIIDEHGMPKWNPEKMMVLVLGCDADDTQAHRKSYKLNPKITIEHDDNGNLPFFANSVPSTTMQWFQHEGKVRNVNDISKLSSWNYKPAQKSNYT